LDLITIHAGYFMTSGELVEALAAKEKISKNKTRSIIKSLVQIILGEVKFKEAKNIQQGNEKVTVETGRQVSIAGLGIFETMVRQARSARNPQTGETLTVPSKRVPKFRPSKSFKEIVSPGRRIWAEGHEPLKRAKRKVAKKAVRKSNKTL